MNAAVRRWIFYFQSLALTIMILVMIGIGVFPNQIREGFRQAINADIARGLEMSVKLAEKSIEHSRVKGVVPPGILANIRKELALYRTDPVGYVVSVTGDDEAANDRLSEMMKSAGPIQKSILMKMMEWREKIKIQFTHAFNSIIIYLIVFFATNIFALMLAIYLIRWVPDRIPHLFSTSLMLTLVVGFSSFIFLDRDWTYAFIANKFNLNAYPVGLSITFLYVLFQYHKYRVILKSG